jgi:chaperonin GroEL
VENPMILVTDKKVSSIQDILPVIEEMVQNGKKDLILIAEDIDSEALATLVVNKVRGVFNAYAVQAPAFGERRKAILEDIAILVGASFVNSDLSMDLKNVKMADLGSAKKVIIGKDKTVIVGGFGDSNIVSMRAEQIKKAISETKSDYDREKAEERLAKLVGGVAVIKVGASTEVEMKELKYVVEDAVNATKAAVAEGVVPGGASTLVRLSVALNDLKLENEEENMGVKILQKALLKPFRAIAENSGIYDIAIILDQIQKGSKNGFVFKTLTEIDDMFSAGIIDPKKVLREAISNSSSIACSIMTTEVVICDEPKAETADAGASAMGGMGGMGF